MNEQEFCRYYRLGYCSRGTKCFYLHANVPSALVVVTPLTEGSSAQYNGKESSIVIDDESNSTTKLSVTEKEWMENNGGIENVWNFTDENNDSDGAYFYGAPGTLPVSTKVKPVHNTPLQYSKLIEQGYRNIDSNDTKNGNSKTIQKNGKLTSEVCKFFSLGSCNFGTRCRNLHISIDVLNSDQSSADIDEAEQKQYECGICLESPLSKGIFGMLNNCDCKFCLECIRNWRKDGLSIAKAEQVRLCPLCRNVSYYIIPSKRYVIGKDKVDLVETYKETVAKKPCKHFAKGSCPFGSSCFYVHVDRKGNIVDKTPRILVKDVDQILVDLTNDFKLSDFMTH
eukprot:gene16843-23070_t